MRALDEAVSLPAGPGGQEDAFTDGLVPRAPRALLSGGSGLPHQLTA